MKKQIRAVKRKRVKPDVRDKKADAAGKLIASYLLVKLSAAVK